MLVSRENGFAWVCKVPVGLTDWNVNEMITLGGGEISENVYLH